MTNMTLLCELSRKHETDKGGQHSLGGAIEHCHEYTPIYDFLLGDIRNEVKSVLEIGVNTGRSLRLWEEYFPNAQIVGFDNKPECQYTAGRVRSFVADQSNWSSLLDAIDASGVFRYDLIIDDGSHEPAHQIFSMQHLLQFLTPGGYYVIEDIHCDFMEIGKCVPKGFLWKVPPTPGGRGCGATEQLMVIHRDHSY